MRNNLLRIYGGHRLNLTSISECQNARYDTLGPYAYWWFLALGESQYDSATTYNLGVYAYYGSPNHWTIVGYPE